MVNLRSTWRRKMVFPDIVSYFIGKIANIPFLGNTEIVNLLIDNGATIDILDADFATPLYRAVEKSEFRNFFQ